MRKAIFIAQRVLSLGAEQLIHNLFINGVQEPAPSLMLEAERFIHDLYSNGIFSVDPRH